MILDAIFWLGKSTCGALALEANSYCMTSRDIKMLGAMMIIMPIAAIALPMFLRR